ncbi:phage tail protein [Specibacter sp. RAF43]|uniref:phage tail protein n=1 Tax=Specibacter sp. RAF43 TaxID=3233057 RepID=UPI003F99D09B
MSEPFIGEIRMFGGDYAPEGWALCDGQLLSIQQNMALYSVIQLRFGGNGVVNFALPDLRGRVPVHAGQGLGLSYRDIGEYLGEEAVTLTTNELPAHLHGGTTAAAVQTSDRPGAGLAPAPGGSYGVPSSGVMASTQFSGGNVGHENMQPSLVVNFIIALDGIFPSRG